MLRAMVLHVILALVAAFLFVLAGIDGLYPLATDMIHAMQAQSIQNQLHGNPIGPMGFAMIVSAQFVAMLALLLWDYRSITNVRRYALRFQAALFLILCVAFALWGVARSPERSSFEATLDPRLAPGFWAYFNKLLDLPRTLCEGCPQRQRMRLRLPVRCC